MYIISGKGSLYHLWHCGGKNKLRITFLEKVLGFNHARFAQSRRLRVHSHLRFIRRELLRELFSPCNHEKWVHNPLLDFSVPAKVA